MAGRIQGIRNCLLRNTGSWGMPDFIGGLAKGIEKSRGMIENAMNGVTSDLNITPRVKLVSDTSYGSLWEVSFVLKEF